MRRKMAVVFLALVMVISTVAGQWIPYSSANVKAASTTLVVHYGGRDKGDYKGWNLWVWEEGKEGKQVDFNAEDSFGKIAVCNLQGTGKVGFIVRLNEWEDKDVEDDRFIEVKEGVNEIWLTSGKKKVAKKAPKGAKPYDVKKEEKARQDVYKKKNATKIKVHYYGFQKKYKNVEAYATFGEKDSGTYKMQKKDKFGAIYEIGFVNKDKVKTIKLDMKLSDGSKDCESQRIVDLTRAKKNKLEIYLVQGNKEVYYNKKDVVKEPVISNASFAGGKEIVFSIADTMDTSNKDLVEEFSLKDQDGVSYELSKVWSENPGKENSASLMTKDVLDFGKTYTLQMKGHVSTQVSVADAFSTEEFEKAYTYEGDDLGAVYGKDKTDFRLWAPTASEVNINFYKEGSGNNYIGSYAMLKAEKGTWTYTAVGDFKNTYYTYSVTVDGITREAVDPYAKAVGVNGERGMVVDLDATDPEGFSEEKRPSLAKTTDASIYEMHIRDLSADKSSGIKNAGKYLGLTEKGTKNADGLSTGLDHLIDLGVTHVQILPSFDYASVDERKDNGKQYNWGYDPKNYNVPEGSYSTDAADGNVRVNEYKQMVQSLHENGIRVVMDVVYNHTFNIEDSNFQKIVPDYYYRKSGDNYSNGSGCGNETASERAMMRKFIVDSVVYWAKEYHVDGFRFDLMGVHDTETMKAVRKALDEVDSGIIIYGEGWTGGDSSYDESLRAVKKNVSDIKGIAAFDDDFRDGLKGNVFDEKDTGFITGNDAYLEDVKLGIVGATNHKQIEKKKLVKSEDFWAAEPDQCINYASCHDNLTLWDKIQTSMPKASKEDKVRMNKLSAAITFTSQGIPFFQAGEEMLRTKPSSNNKNGFDENSYCSPDSTNSIKWDTKKENQDVYEYYKGLLAFRKAHGALRMTSAQQIQENLKFQSGVKGNAIAYTIENQPNEESAQTLMVIHNGNNKAINVTLPNGTWNVYVNGEKAGTEVLDQVSGTISVDKISTFVLVKESKSGKIIAAIKNVNIKIWIGIGIAAVILIIILIFIIRRRRRRPKMRKEVIYFR